MISRLIHSLKSRFATKALVLMYHRVAELETDVWRLAVSPKHFEQHLQVLKRRYNVVSLAELAEDLGRRSLKRNSIALTFDDGYADNFLVAKPLLEKYKLPATFFISSGSIGLHKEYWWDELEQIFLHTEYLPQTCAFQFGSMQIHYDLGQEQQLTETTKRLHRLWKAYVQPPPTLRCAIFLSMWETLRPLAYHTQQEYLHYIRNWAGKSCTTARPLYATMNRTQLQDLGHSNLFHLGAHTVTHPDLASQNAAAQQQEIVESKAFLKKVAGRKITLLAYPYGRYNDETVKIVTKTNFAAAVTTDEKPIKSNSDKLQLGRFLVDNWSGQKLDMYIKAWKKS